MNEKLKNRKGERGSAGVKLAVFLVALFLVGHAGYNYVPVAYEGQSFKQDMQTAVVQGMATPAGITITDSVKAKLQRAMSSDNIPLDAIVQVKQTDKSVQARVAYTKQVSILPFGLLKYNYQFDYTATPTGFLLKS